MKFNTKSAGSKTVNLAGGEAYSESPKLELISLLLTSFVKDQFYRSEDETLNQVRTLIDQLPDKLFAAKAAIYARDRFNMRSISHVVAGEVGYRVRGSKWTRKFFTDVVVRPDDIIEILSYYYGKYGNKAPYAMERGLRSAFDKFDDYQIAKYQAQERALSMRDVVNHLHPKPTERNAAVLAELIKNGRVVLKDRHETALTQAGEQATSEEEKEALKKAGWTKLISERKIGYFALLRNLNNIIEQAPEMVDQALALLTDENLIRKSRVLPFRFTTAVNEIRQNSGREARQVTQALNRALDISVANVPRYDGETLVVLDSSGSMSGRPAEIGSLFAAVLVKSNNADLMLFSDDAQYISVNPDDSTLSIANSIPFISGGTNFHAIFQNANRKYDRIIILSDMQGWMGYDSPTRDFSIYKQRLNASPKVFSFDLAGYGTLQFPEQDVFALAGFSEKVFDLLKLLETDKSALVHEVEAIDL